MVDERHHGNAVIALSELRQLKFAFASKVCAFLLPEKCSVIDSVGADHHRQLGLEVDGGSYVRRNNTNVANYNKYCAFLIEGRMP